MGNKLPSDLKNDNYKTALVGSDIIEGQTDGAASFGTTFADMIARILPNISTEQTSFTLTDLFMLLDGTTPKKILGSTINRDLRKARINVVSSADYTIIDTDGYTEIWVSTGAIDRTILLPTLADNQGRKIKVIKIDSGTGDVIVDGEGSETINSTLTVNITEQYGWWEFTAGASEWNGKTDGNSTILYVASTSTISCSTASNGWEDASGMNFTLTPGKWLLSLKVRHWLYHSSGQTNIYIGGGLGTVSGNNEANINYVINFTGLTAGYQYYKEDTHLLPDILYTVTTNTTIYLKIYFATSSGGCSNHSLFGAANYPIFIKARRIG